VRHQGAHAHPPVHPVLLERLGGGGATGACGRQQSHLGRPCPGDGLGQGRCAVAHLEEHAHAEEHNSDNGGPKRHNHLELEHGRQWRPRSQWHARASRDGEVEEVEGIEWSLGARPGAFPLGNEAQDAWRGTGVCPAMVEARPAHGSHVRTRVAR
jgi:hypothetical protein